MKFRKVTQCGNLIVAQRMDYKWGVLDNEGNVIVEFGTYDWIDGFAHGLARVKIGKGKYNANGDYDQWGIIDSEGKEVLPPVYDAVWRFYETDRTTTRVEEYLSNENREESDKLEYDFDLISRDLKRRYSREEYYQQRMERDREYYQQKHEHDEAREDAFYYLTEGMYGDYEDFNGSISDLREMMGY